MGSKRTSRNLAQDYVVVKSTPPEPGIVMDGGGLVKTPDGILLAAVPVWPRHNPSYPFRVHICASEDGGKSWNDTGSPLNWYTGIPFIHNGSLYMLGFLPGSKYRNEDILLARSDDCGKTWTEQVTLFKGPYWNTAMGMVCKDGMLYCAIDKLDTPQRKQVVLAGDLGTDLLSPDHWRMSNELEWPGTPDKLSRKMYPPGKVPNTRVDMWLEGNVVNVNGSLRLLVRCDIDGKASSGIAAVGDIEDDGTNMNLSFTQFYPIPGAQCKFAVIYDPVSELFWSAVNIPTDSQDFFNRREKWYKRGFLGAPGNERRFLILQYSLDALNWFQAGCIASWPSALQGFQYASPLIDGNDLLILVRTSKDGLNQHDADMMTFHRVRKFRELAMNLREEL